MKSHPGARGGTIVGHAMLDIAAGLVEDERFAAGWFGRMNAWHDGNRRDLLRIGRRTKMLRRLRPTSLASVLLGVFSERKIIEVEGLRIFADACSHLGHELLTTGSYEPETIAQLRDSLHTGATFLDIGANEGFFSSLAATLVGPTGRVIAVEPQARLLDIIEINLGLNARCRTDIVPAVLSDTDDQSLNIFLYPVSNTGASSLVRKHRLSSKTQSVATITVSRICENLEVSEIGLVKVDVEGFEPEVVRSLLPLVEAKRIERLLIDYHVPILRERGLDPERSHQSILACGYKAISGTVTGGYVLYERA